MKLEEVFDETVKAGTTIQEELKSVIPLRCVGGQLKSYSNLTIGDNVQYPTLREHVLQWDRFQQKWATADPNGRRQSLGEWIELTKDSSLATLRAAFSFLGISGSGSKLKVYTKIFNRNKKMVLLNAKSLVSGAKAQETRKSVAKMPDEATQARHRLTHMPYANWCKERIEHGAPGVKRGSTPEICYDFATRAQGTQKQSQQEQYVG